MKVSKARKAVLAFLIVLCAVSLIFIGFSLIKKDKINAYAAPNVSLNPGVTNGNFATGIWMDNSPGVAVDQGICIKENTATTTTNSGYYRFSLKITVPAFTEYTVSYPMAYTAGICAGSGTASGTMSVERYEDNTYATVKATYTSGNWYSSGYGNYTKHTFVVSNLIFANDTAIPKDFYTYFSLQVTTLSKTGANGVFLGTGIATSNITVNISTLSLPTTSDTLTYTYDGSAHTVNFDYAQAQPARIDLDGNSVSYANGHKNVNVTVTAVDADGVTTNSYTTTPANLSNAASTGSITATNAGTYTVKFSLTSSAISNGITWNGGGIGDQTIILKINRANSTVTPVIGAGPFYANNDLYTDVSITTTAGDTAGNIAWDSGQTLAAGTNNYTWKFTPTDTANYNTKTGTEAITAQAVTITNIRVVFNQGSTVFYTSNAIDDLKSRLAVFKVYNDSSESAVGASDYTLSGNMTVAGATTITVTYTSTAAEQPAMTDFTDTFSANITAVQLQSITATYTPAGDIYVSSAIDDLKQNLTVTGTYNDGSTATMADADYTLTVTGGAFTAGTVTVTVTPNADNSVTNTFMVNVLADPVVIELNLPQADDFTYSGEEFDIKDKLNLTSTEIATYLDVSGTETGKDAGEYTVKFRIKNAMLGSVKWKTASAPAKYEIGGIGKAAAELSADGTTATLKWKINKAKVSAVWDSANSVWVAEPGTLAEIAQSDFLTQVYTDAEGKEYTSESELKGGVTYKVTARINSAYAKNIELDENTQQLMASGDGTYTPIYKPTIWERIFNFVKTNWLWFAIGGGIFLFLLLLIIILAATKRKRKEKAEERKLEKERKAEEKARKEEERRLKEEQREEEKRRREQEREDAKAKAEAERELQKAKAEAELAKMSAEMGMAGAGAMAMQAMAQPQQQMPMQPMQYMQPQYQQPQYPQYPPMPPQPYPQMPQQSYDGGNARINQLEMEVAKLKAESDIRTVGMDERAKTAYFAPMQAGPMIMQSRESVPEHNAKQGMTAEILGEAILTAITKLVENKANAPVQAIPVSVEKSNPVSVAYPPDAVVTTTTTVDTTKAPTAPKPQRITREDDNKYFDIDGFYDTFEEDN